MTSTEKQMSSMIFVLVNNNKKYIKQEAHASSRIQQILFKIELRYDKLATIIKIKAKNRILT